MKQIQVEQFLKSYKIDIYHLQEAQIREDTFEMCDFINNASNQYVGDTTFANVYTSQG